MICSLQYLLENKRFSNSNGSTYEHVLTLTYELTNEINLFRMYCCNNRAFFLLNYLTNQAIDLVLQNDALHKRVMEPLKRKMLPFIASVFLTNLAMFILLVYLARRLSLLPLPLPLPLPHTLPLPPPA